MSLRNRLVLPLVLSSLAFLAACGGSSNNAVPPPSGAFSNSNFTGTYTFSVSGGDANGRFAMAGSLMPNGTGGFTGGTVDMEDPTGPIIGATVGTTSSYNVTKDGRGLARLFMTSGGAALTEVDLDFVLTSGSHGLISRYDGNGSASGTIDSQGSGVSLGAASYAFSLSGTDNLGNPLATVGGFTLDSGGNILTTGATAGIEDFAYGFPSNTGFQGVALSGTVTAGSPGFATLASSFGTLSFDVYTVDATHVKLIENDGQYILVGDVFTQPAASIPTGTYVFTVAGLDPGGNPFAAGGTVTSDGTSLLPSGLEDINDDGVIDGGATTATPSSFNGTFAATPAGGGRFLLNLTNFLGGTLFAAYPSSGGILMLEVDTAANAGITGGVLMPQTTGASIVSSQGYGFNLTGDDLFNVVEIDEIAQFNTTSSTSLTGLLDEDDGGTLGTSNLSGTITAGSGGAGSVSLNSGIAGFFYYAASSTSIPFISTDSGVVGVGILEGQSTPTSAHADVVQRHLAMLKAATKARPTAKHGEGHFTVKR